MKQITGPSYLHVRACGYVAVIGWGLTFQQTPSPLHSVHFTPDNLGPKRADDFHKGLLATVRATYEDTELSWVTITTAPLVADVSAQLKALLEGWIGEENSEHTRAKIVEQIITNYTIQPK